MELTRLMNVLQALWGASLGQGTEPSSVAATVREVHLHPRLPMAVVQHASAEAFGASVPIGRLPAAAAAAARRLLSLSMLRLSHPTAPITAAASHSRLSFWSEPQTGCAILLLQPKKNHFACTSRSRAASSPALRLGTPASSRAQAGQGLAQSEAGEEGMAGSDCCVAVALQWRKEVVSS